MAIIKCPECGGTVSDHARICPHCGVAIAGQLTNCPDCGEIILKEIPQCPYCHCTINGAEQQAYVAPVAQPRHSAAPSGASAGNDDGPQQSAKKKPKHGYATIVVSVVLALIVVLLGLHFYQTSQQQNEQRAFQNAITSGEPAVLQNFLAVYDMASPQHRDSIGQRLQQLEKIEQEWQQALSSLDRQKLAAYVSRHPGNAHVAEANVLIDSLDWQKALADNTMEGYQVYLDEHPEGANVPEARDRHDQLNNQRLKPEDEEQVLKLLNGYLTALSQRDEPALRSCLTPSCTYMGQENQSPWDAVDHMRSLYVSDITAITFSLAGQLDITKLPAPQEGLFVYEIKGAVEERIDRTDPSRERFASYVLTAKINAKGKFSELNFK